MEPNSPTLISFMQSLKPIQINQVKYMFQKE